ncbi:histidine kinase [Streptomyces sp. NPDC053728]|uniref:sensor histidine kinase n=1 Tax=Streptomyces sp. NPDC053728 TaxID=3155534 RepID=UPI0034252A45
MTEPRRGRGGEAVWVGAQVRRWRGRSSFGKIDLYTRGSLHSLAWVSVVPPALLSVTRPVRESGAPAALIAGTVLAALGQALCSKPLVTRALDTYLGRPSVDRRLVALGAVLFLATASGVVALGAYAGAEEFAELPLALGAAVVPFMISVTLVVPVWVGGLLQAVTAAVLCGGVALAGGDGATVLGVFLGVAFGSALMTGTTRLSAWSLGVMAKLHGAQEVETRLAVAEERLRFGRDMHDVLGRNLAVIALKSELAVELAQRGKPAAMDQMVEVQRIARVSQQEVRDIVRGYREADLGTELLGAQGVLRAAGIECDVRGDGGQLPAAVQAALGWAVREAATNVLRHGDPRRCDIRLETARDGVRLVVENDGVPPERAAASGGSGLHGLRERLAAVGGSLVAGPTGDGRFRLAAAVPLPSPRNSAPSRLEKR